jgi:hypothetical protein
VLDLLQGLLGRLAGSSLTARPVTDGRGDVRVVLRLPTWAHFLHTGLDDLLAAALGSPMVLLRARRLLLDLLTVSSLPDRRTSLASRLEWIERELAERYPLFWREAAETEPLM